MKNATEVYRTLRQKLTGEYLKELCSEIIQLYRRKQYTTLRKYISLNNFDPGIRNERLFALLMKKYHPDRITAIHKQIETLRESDDFKELMALYNSYFYKIEAVDPGEESVDFRQSYSYGSEDFGYREKEAEQEDDFGESSLHFEDEDFSVIDAINQYYFGGLEHSVSEADLKTIEEELDLSDYEIYRLDGIEHCIYLEELNLSDNCIERIARLTSLTRLKTLYLANNRIEDIETLNKLEMLETLDLSFNRITDISPISSLINLKYVNLLGNPVEDYAPLEKMIRRGTLVIYEDNILR